jgi:hypothetical protein
VSPQRRMVDEALTGWEFVPAGSRAFGVLAGSLLSEPLDAVRDTMVSQVRGGLGLQTVSFRASAATPREAAALAAVGEVMDPFAPIYAEGVDWLAEQVGAVREPLDWLAGDPREIRAQAQAWREVGRRILASADAYATTLLDDTYLAETVHHVESVRAVSELSDLLAEVVLAAGAAVGETRTELRDLVAGLVHTAIGAALRATTPVLVTRAVAEVDVLVAEASFLIAAKLRELYQLLGKLTSRVVFIREQWEGAGEGALLTPS